MAFVGAFARTSGGRVIVYEDIASKQTCRQYGSRSWRTSNPGNIGKGRFATKHGAIGDDGVNAIFPDVETGFAALAALLKGKSYCNKTIPEAMARYAPAPANDPAAYARFLLRNTGLSEDRTIASLTEEEFGKLLKAIQTYEGWKEGKIIPPAPSPASAV